MKTLDQYIESVPKDKQKQFDSVWRAVHEVAPYADVGMSYGVPALLFKGKPLIAVAAFTNHVGVYPFGSTHIKSLKKELADYETMQGGFKLKEGQTVTKKLLKKMITLRKEELEASVHQK